MPQKSFYQFDGNENVNPEDRIERGPFRFNPDEKINPEDRIERGPFRFNPNEKIDPEKYLKPAKQGGKIDLKNCKVNTAEHKNPKHKHKF